jgi:hypothetical protein
VERLETRGAEEAGGTGKGGGIEAALTHAGEVYLATGVGLVQIARPKKRVHMQIDDDRFSMDAKRLGARLDQPRPAAVRRLEVDGEEGPC